MREELIPSGQVAGDGSRRAEGDVERAQYGIIYIDEIDKVTSVTTHAGRCQQERVQTNLRKLTRTGAGTACPQIS